MSQKLDDLLKDVKRYVSSDQFAGEFAFNKIKDVSFLARGEYNINFLLITDAQRYVLRINTGSQMHLDNQIRYEYNALNILKKSGVTPEPLYLDDGKKNLPYGLLIMEFLPGRSLIYQKDLEKAAGIFASIHGLNTRGIDSLIREEQPLTGIWQECNQLVQRYLDSNIGNNKIKQYLQKVRSRLLDQVKIEKEITDLLPFSIVNTEVNSGNFLINKDTDNNYLIDWEKPLITSPLQDLSHFMVPTTTLWKTDYLMDKKDREIFQKKYLNLRGLENYSQFNEAIDIFNQFSAFRGISWSAMAWVEYQQSDRLIKNEDTFNKISEYLDIDFLKNLFVV